MLRFGKYEARQQIGAETRLDWLTEVAEGLRYAHSKGGDPPRRRAGQREDSPKRLDELRALERSPRG